MQAPSLRGAFFMRRTLAVRRVSVVVHTRALRNCALSRTVSGVIRYARCASLLVCAWLQSPRAPHAIALPIQERFSPAFRLVFLFLHTKLCWFWPLRLCCSAPLRLVFVLRFCASAPLSALLFYLLCICFCSASRLDVASSAFASASAFVSALHSLVGCDFYNYIDWNLVTQPISATRNYNKSNETRKGISK